MEIVEVSDKKTAKAFLEVPKIIYASDPNWIPHLYRDIEAVFDPRKNLRFQNGEAIRWILRDTEGRLAGRVAAFIDRSLANTFSQPTGGMGFFECIDQQEAAFLLFDTCKEWLAARGMEAMDGPINFGDKERFWGLLVDGFEIPPPYLMNYNPPYYKNLFEAYGFKNYYEQYVYHIESKIELPAILEKKFQRLTETQGYHFEHMRLKHMEKYAEDFMLIYNQAWGEAHNNFQPITKKQVMANFAGMKAVIDEQLIIFGYHHGKPVAFFVSIPELNQIFRYVNGKLNLMGKLKFLYYKWLGKCRIIYGLVFGIIPEYQNRGLESALIMSLKHIVSKRYFYKSMYVTWLGDFNPKIIRIVEHIGAKRALSLICYRHLFDEQATFERHPVIGGTR